MEQSPRKGQKFGKMGIDKFNETIAIWMDGLNSVTLDQLLAKPDEKSWSLGQLYEHLIEESNWYNGQIELSLNDRQHANTKRSDEADILFRAKSFANEKIQGDPLIAENVNQPTSIHQLKSDLKKLKACTNEIWERMEKADDYGKSEHPGIGYLSCYEWLQYSEMHMRHHLRQKRRIEMKTS